jgi:hypothetical protein
VGKRTVRGNLVDGVVTLVLERLAPGQKTISITYAGDGVAEKASAKRTVEVRS